MKCSQILFFMFIFLIVFVISVYVCVCVHVCHKCMWSSENYFWKSVLFSHFVETGSLVGSTTLHTLCQSACKPLSGFPGSASHLATGMLELQTWAAASIFFYKFWDSNTGLCVSAARASSCLTTGLVQAISKIPQYADHRHCRWMLREGTTQLRKARTRTWTHFSLYSSHFLCQGNLPPAEDIWRQWAELFSAVCYSCWMM